MDFPHDTCNKMIDIVTSALNYTKEHFGWRTSQISKLEDLLTKFQHTEFMATTETSKANRWFGYYQKVGEELDLWTLDQVIQWVRDEHNG